MDRSAHRSCNSRGRLGQQALADVAPAAAELARITIEPSVLLLSVVSHAQGRLVQTLLEDLKGCSAVPFRVILTVNVPEQLPFDAAAFPFPVRVLRNAAPRGFGANHNAAFAACAERFFCVLNPDIRLPRDPFPDLISRLENSTVGAVAPLIRGPSGSIEDSARQFPTLPLLFLKLIESQKTLPPVSEPFRPDWIAGMFMLFRRDAFAAVGGFDEGYFMYYEDVDLCARLRAAGMRVEVNPAACAVHDARRASRRSLRHMLWHAGSMARFLGLRGRSARLPE